MAERELRSLLEKGSVGLTGGIRSTGGNRERGKGGRKGGRAGGNGEGRFTARWRKGKEKPGTVRWCEGRPSLGLKLRLVHLIPCHLDPGMGLEDLGLVSLPVHPPRERSASLALAAGPGRHGVTPSFGSEGGEASDGV